jgi:AcrR family transcriptional regulator
MKKHVVKRRARAPDVTREKLSRAAFEEIYRRGFQGASLDTRPRRKPSAGAA